MDSNRGHTIFPQYSHVLCRFCFFWHAKSKFDFISHFDALEVITCHLFYFVCDALTNVSGQDLEHEFGHKRNNHLGAKKKL